MPLCELHGEGPSAGYLRPTTAPPDVPIPWPPARVASAARCLGGASGSSRPRSHRRKHQSNQRFDLKALLPQRGHAAAGAFPSLAGFGLPVCVWPARSVPFGCARRRSVSDLIWLGHRTEPYPVCRDSARPGRPGVQTPKRQKRVVLYCGWREKAVLRHFLRSVSDVFDVDAPSPWNGTYGEPEITKKGQTWSALGSQGV